MYRSSSCAPSGVLNSSPPGSTRRSRRRTTHLASISPMLTPGHRSRISTMTARLEQRPVQEFLRRLRDLDDRLGQDLGRRLVVSRAVLIRVTSSPEAAAYPRSSSWSGTPARGLNGITCWKYSRVACDAHLTIA